MKKHQKKIGVEHILYFTPSIDYAALYAPPYQDPKDGKWAQVVFQYHLNQIL